jgi:hypothetical protein
MSATSKVYFTDIPLLNKTPSEGIVLSMTVFAVPMVRDLNNVVPLSGVPFINSTSPAVPPEVIEKPFSRTLLELATA